MQSSPIVSPGMESLSTEPGQEKKILWFFFFPLVLTNIFSFINTLTHPPTYLGTVDLVSNNSKYIIF